MPSWPAILPTAPLNDGFRETMPVTTVRTDMEAGPTKVRRRTTAGVRKLTLAYLLTKAQVETLENFVAGDIAGGALSFTFSHPRTSTLVNCRFARLPEYATLNGGFFKTSFELEVLP